MIDNKRVKELAEKWLEDKDYFLVETSVDKENRVVVTIDNKDGVWIEDCCELSRFIEANIDREDEDYELEVGSAGLGQPFKVLQQFQNYVGEQVEVMTGDGRKLTGALAQADETGFDFTYVEKQKVEGKKRPQNVEVGQHFGYDDVKWVKAVINFK